MEVPGILAALARRPPEGDPAIVGGIGRSCQGKCVNRPPPQSATGPGRFYPFPWAMLGPRGAAFSKVFASFYAILAANRNWRGVTPATRRKWWQNWLWSEKPALAATSASGRSPRRKNCLARSTRRAMT